MGCVASKKDINDLHPNIFQVMNVDQSGHQISPGQLEITETDLVLYQRKKPTVKWPLRRLRRYGFEREIFSFESGRRCPTGQGIYAFHCLRADQLFNLVQAHIQVRNIVGEDGVMREFPSIGPVVPMPTSNATTSGDSNYLEPAPFNRRSMLANNRFVSQNGGNIRRLGSVGSSNGPLSPQGTASPSPPPLSAPCLPSVPSHTTANTLHYTNEERLATASALPVQDSSEYNNNKPHNQRTYMNSASVLSTDSADDPMDDDSNKEVEDGVTTPYVNVDIGTGTSLPPSQYLEQEANYARLNLGAELQPCHLYMNVVPGQENGVPVGIKDKRILFRRPSDQIQDESRRCYANLEPSEIEIARSHLPKRLSGSERLPPLPSSVIAHSPLSPPPGVLRQVNYIVLDLDKTKADIKSSNSIVQQTTTPESSGGPSEGYATIDFNKTVALSHSVNPNVHNDSEGSRKTRHNSTINDLVVSLD